MEPLIFVVIRESGRLDVCRSSKKQELGEVTMSRIRFANADNVL